MQGSITLKCSCGKLIGEIERSAADRSTRALCFCADCQAFAHYLGNHETVLDSQGGSDVIQISPARISFSEGKEYLACLRLSNNGMIRWYAQCCNTPIGNTMAHPKVPFIGLLHKCMHPSEGESLDDVFGPATMVAYPEFAQGEPKPNVNRWSLMLGGARLVKNIITARLIGDARRNPFFDFSSGTPIVPPTILSEQEREDLRTSVGA